MATAKATQAMLNASFECSVCHDVFRDTRHLSCGHTICLKCLQNIVHAAVIHNGSTVEVKIPCPQCRTEFSVDSKTLQNLPENCVVVADVMTSLPANSQCVKNTVYCECKIHPKIEVESYCETCRRFACSTCTGVNCKQHTVLKLPDADDKFKIKLNATLKLLQAISSILDGDIQDIISNIEHKSSHHDTVQDDIDKLLSQTEAKLKEQLLAEFKQCKHAAKLTISKLHSENMDKLNTSLADAQKLALNIQQHKATIEQHLATTSTVFDRFKVVMKLDEIQNETSQGQANRHQPDTIMYDISKWQNDMTAWLHDTSGALTTATTRLPQLTLQSFVKHSPTLADGQVKLAKHKSNFTINPSNGNRVDVLSVSSEGQQLVGQWWGRQLHVYSAGCSHVTSITLHDDDIVIDAVWTRRGNIVYSEWRGSKVVAMSLSGDIIQRTNVSQPSFLSVSTDDIIYLISGITSVYQSTDDGLTWNHMFNFSDNCKCFQVIKVSTDGNGNTDVLWTIVKSTEDFRLRVYTVDKRRAVGDNVTWRDVTVPSRVTVALSYSKLAYDGHKSIFVTDSLNKAVHVWSVSGQYDRQLVSLQQFSFTPHRIAVDTQRHVMYVGDDNGTVGVFELIEE